MHLGLLHFFVAGVCDLIFGSTPAVLCPVLLGEFSI